MLLVLGHGAPRLFGQWTGFTDLGFFDTACRKAFRLTLFVFMYLNVWD